MLSNTRTSRAERISGEHSLLRAFQTRLEALRRETGLSRRAFADRLGIPRSSYFHLMSDAGNPSLDTVELIAERVGVHPSALFPPPSAVSPLDDQSESPGEQK
ncbi:helix-turn-helix domain-containing protein [Rhizobium multihospitium]|uniref:Transcriptional regulator n=1 Tax=Rhizobium multihospitium TaxID=410764 RepID=A0A1C3XDK0_9HYPH|nr:helix-turn-helix transcriptional regulator [Rhizobium multihospitium]SCB50343.1 transcriptional regulator [Rhizobium multihospitium]